MLIDVQDAVKTKKEAAIEDLYKIDEKAEIVNGRIVYLTKGK
jgi:hypothetical protein